MLELEVKLRQLVEPLIYDALKTPLDRYAEQHWRTADQALTSVTFRRGLAALAAEHFARRQGNAHWRGIVDKGTTKQTVIDLVRIRARYSAHAQTSAIHTEDATKLTGTMRRTP
jgi:hypothetical protein